MERFNVTIDDDRGGRFSSALAETYEGNVVSTVARYNSDGHDLAIIEVPAENVAEFQAALDADERVISY